MELLLGVCRLRKTKRCHDVRLSYHARVGFCNNVTCTVVRLSTWLWYTVALEQQGETHKKRHTPYFDLYFVYHIYFVNIRVYWLLQ